MVRVVKWADGGMCGQEQPIVLSKQKRALKGRSAGDFSTDFEFGERDGLYSEDWVMADVMAQLKKRVSGLSRHSSGLLITLVM